MWSKGAVRLRQVGTKKASESDTTDDVSKGSVDDIKTEGGSLLRDESGGRPADCPGGVRHGGGASLAQALVWNGGNLRLDSAVG